MLETDSVHWSDSISVGKCKAKANVSGQYPVAGTTRLVDSIRGWLGTQLSCNMENSGATLFRPTPSELSSGQKLAERCGKAMLQSARSDFDEFEDNDISVSYEYSYSFGPSYQSDSILTYYFSGYVYLGGAHGGALGGGQSFATSSGLSLTSENMFKAEKRPELINLIRKALWNQYFKEGCEPGSTLKDALLINPDTLSLPQMPPLFSKDGLVFTYQQYEIACYAAGMPSCVLPYTTVEPLLKPEVARLLKGQE